MIVIIKKYDNNLETIMTPYLVKISTQTGNRPVTVHYPYIGDEHDAEYDTQVIRES